MSFMRNKRLAWALHLVGVNLGVLTAEAQRRHDIAEAARARINGPPMTEEERRRFDQERREEMGKAEARRK